MAKKAKGGALRPPSDKDAPASLSAEERALWEHAARDLQPLRTKAERVTKAQAEADAVPRRLGEAKAPRQPAPRAPPPRPAKTAPPPSDLGRRQARRIGSGRIDIEAKIDLHGLRQAEAHAELRRFLAGAHADGRRWVLVITGKGGGVREGSEAAGYARESERGVLRRNVPRWLAEPELRSIVVGYSSAAVRHGGEGALYVQLRRKDRSGSDKV